MSRHNSRGSYGHRIKMEREDEYVISWTYDVYYPGSRLRHPVGRQRDTNRKGAQRFAKKHGIEMPKPIEVISYNGRSYYVRVYGKALRTKDGKGPRLFRSEATARAAGEYKLLEKS